MKLAAGLMIRIPVRATLSLVPATGRKMALLTFEMERRVPSKQGEPCGGGWLDHPFSILRIRDAVLFLFSEVFDGRIETHCIAIFSLIQLLYSGTLLLLSCPCLAESLLCSLLFLEPSQIFARSFLRLRAPCYTVHVQA